MTTPREMADAVYEKPLSAEEFERRLAAARAELAGPEGDELRAYVVWFMKRYPHPLDRLRYARRKYREAEAMRGLAR